MIEQTELILNGILKGEDNNSKIEQLERHILSFFTPMDFQTKENVEVESIVTFEKVSSMLIYKGLTQNPKKLSLLEYLIAVDNLKTILKNGQQNKF